MAEDAAATFARLKKEAKTRGEAIKSFRSLLKDLPGQLADAQKAQDALQIEAVDAACDGLITNIENQLADVKLMVDDIHAIEADKAFLLAHVAEFKLMVKGVSDIRSELTKDLAEAKKLQKDTRVANAAQQDTQDDALRELAVLERNMNAFKGVERRVSESKTLLADAQWAVDHRDAKLLASTQDFARRNSVTGFYPTLAKIESDVADLLTKFRAKGFEDKVMKDIEQQAKEILQNGGVFRKKIDDVDANLNKVLDLEVADIDLAKAAKALGIEDKAQRAELEKILNGEFDQIEKKLDALGQKLSPKAKGRGMLAELKKAKVL